MADASPQSAGEETVALDFLFFSCGDGLQQDVTGRKLRRVATPVAVRLGPAHLGIFAMPETPEAPPGFFREREILLCRVCFRARNTSVMRHASHPASLTSTLPVRARRHTLLQVFEKADELYVACPHHTSASARRADAYIDRKGHRGLSARGM